MRFFIVDAFTTSLFGGNPAGVVFLGQSDFPQEALMQKTAAELRYSETAFVRQLGENEFHTRYFTPSAEVDLCGHATIALFHALAEDGRIASEGSCVNRTLAGNLNISLTGGFVFMEMGAPQKLGEIRSEEELRALYSVMGIPQSTPLPGAEMLPDLVSTGLPDIMLPVPDEAALAAIAPDFPALAKLSENYDVVGVHAFTLRSEDGLTHVRNFAPRYAIDEEAATGTSNGALAYYLYQRGKLEAGRRIPFIQGESMGRRSEIVAVAEENDAAVSIRVGGRAVTLAEGEIRL